MLLFKTNITYASSFSPYSVIAWSDMSCYGMVFAKLVKQPAAIQSNIRLAGF